MREIRYVFEKPDFVALTRALVRPSLLTTVFRLFFAVIIAANPLIVMVLRGAENVSPEYLEIYARYLPLWFLPLFFALFGTQVAGLAAAYVFKRNASANKEIVVELQENFILARSEDIRSEVSWKSVVKVIETDRHLLLALSKREALTLPKRAVASEDEIADVMHFVSSHVSPQTPIVKYRGLRTIDMRSV